MSLQQFCVRWNNHLKIFQSALPKYFQNQKFLDCTLVVEGQHLVQCHRMVLDACSDYFSNFLKNKLFDDKNIVILLPNEIRLWQMQAILQFMYQGEVCISQEGLPSLVKCAELLQVKGLCGSDPSTIVSADNQDSDNNENNHQHHHHNNNSNNNSNNNTNKTTDRDSILNRALQNKYARENIEQNDDDDDDGGGGGGGGGGGVGGGVGSNDFDEDDYCPEMSIPAIEIDENNSDIEFNGQIIKREININDVLEEDDSEERGDELKSNQLDDNSPHYNSHSTNSKMPPQSQNKQHSNKEQQSDKHGLIRVKSNLFEIYQPENQAKKQQQQQQQHQNQECNDNNSSLSGTCNNKVSEVAITSGNGTDETMANALVYNKNAMDIYVKTKETAQEVVASKQSTVRKTLPKQTQQTQQKKQVVKAVNQFEDIICAPNLLEFNMSEDEDEEVNDDTNDVDFNMKSKTNDMDSTFMESENEISAFYMPSDMTVATSDSLYDMISQNFANDTMAATGTTLFNGSGESGSNNLLISSVSSLNMANKKFKTEQDHTEGKLFKNLQKLCSTEKKPAIGGLYLRNPRGNQVRQYDVNALYSALQDVKNGHSIYRAAQTYSVPRKTLRNWMKRLHIKSAYPMPRQLQQAAERKKIMQQKNATLNIGMQ